MFTMILQQKSALISKLISLTVPQIWAVYYNQRQKKTRANQKSNRVCKMWKCSYLNV